jgi:hypothetical protein
MAIEKRHRFQRLAALELPKDAFEQGAEGLGEGRIKYLVHLCVARGTLNPRDGLQLALGPLLVIGQERGRCEGKHDKRRHERIREGNLGIAPAMIRAVVEAVSNQAKEGIGTEMLASFWSNDGHGKTPQKNLKSFQGEGYFRIDVLRKGNRERAVVIEACHSPGIAAS